MAQRPAKATASPAKKSKKKRSDKSTWDLLREFWEVQKQWLAEEVENTKAFTRVLVSVWNQLKDMVSDIMAGGLKERSERQLKQRLAAREAREAEQHAKFMDMINQLPMPWRTARQQQQQQEGQSTAVDTPQVEGQAQQAGSDQQQPSSDATSTTQEAARAARKANAPPSALRGGRQSLKRVRDRLKQAQAAAKAKQAPAQTAHSSTHVDPNNVWSPLESKVHELDSQLSEAKRKLQELEEELEVITRYHGTGTKYDFGPDDMFAGLAGRCLADTGTRWTYEACFFDRAIQKEPHNPNNKVSLGTWHGWAKDYTEAVFANGDACAGAPARSLTVRLVCGDEERMYGGEEPATCVYTVTMTTPLACRQHDLQKELDKLAELERFEAEVRAEIEASEKARRSKDHSEL